MTDNPKLEIPDAVRELAERNVDQARAAYGQFVEMAQKAQNMVAESQGAMANSAREIQSQALKYASQNIDSNFDFAAELARARDLKEYMEIQTRYAQQQMTRYGEQAQELGRLMSDAVQKAQPKG